MKLLPGLDLQIDTGKMTEKQAHTIVVLVYISVLLYSAMLVLEVFNTYKYLYVKKRYKAFPVLLFYVLSIPSTIFRIYENIFIIEIVMYQYAWLVMMPALFKICISFSQILVMLELTVRINQSMQTSMIVYKKKQIWYDRLVLVLRVTAITVSILFVGGWTAACALARLNGEDAYESMR